MYMLSMYVCTYVYIYIVTFVTESAGFICTANYTHLMSHNVPCELANNTRLCIHSIIYSAMLSLSCVKFAYLYIA